MGIGPTKAKALSEKGINTVGDLLASSAVNISAAVRSSILKATPGAYQDKTIDHRNNPNQPNPYLSLYGDNWKEKCDATAFMKKCECITQVWKDVMSATIEGFRGTTHENDFFIYHDALSLLCAKSTGTYFQVVICATQFCELRSNFFLFAFIY